MNGSSIDIWCLSNVTVHLFTVNVSSYVVPYQVNMPHLQWFPQPFTNPYTLFPPQTKRPCKVSQEQILLITFYSCNLPELLSKGLAGVLLLKLLQLDLLGFPITLF